MAIDPIAKIEIAELCKGVRYVDLGESFQIFIFQSLSMSLFLNFFSNEIAIQTHIYLQNLASIQPRTSPVKFDRSRGAARQRRDPRAERSQVRRLRSQGLSQSKRRSPKHRLRTSLRLVSKKRVLDSPRERKRSYRCQMHANFHA